MQIPIYQLDAFTTRVFHGNPAAVCMLDEWLPAPVMQSIAAENNLAETAFCVAAIDVPGVIATAPGSDCDYVSRFFGPGAGVPEYPATGSAHCTLIPYWAERLGKDVLFGRQVSSRGGEFYGRNLPGRVEIAGHVVLYMRGAITV